MKKTAFILFTITLSFLFFGSNDASAQADTVIELAENARKNSYKVTEQRQKIYIQAINVFDPIKKKRAEGEGKLRIICDEKKNLQTSVDALFDNGRTTPFLTPCQNRIVKRVLAVIESDITSSSLSASSTSAAPRNTPKKYDWAISSKGKSIDEGTSVCMDSAGNSYIAGSFSSRPFAIGNFSFVNTSTPSYKESMDMFVAKLDKNGKAVWAIRSEGKGNEKATDIACDKTGHIVVIGSIKGKNVKFGTEEINNPRDNSMSTFILRVNNLGKINWVKNETGSANVKAVSTGPDGEIFITGTSNLRAKFTDRDEGPKNKNAPTAFVAKYKHNGYLEWLHHIHGKSGGGQKSRQSGEAIFATNDSRFVYVAGWFRGHVKFSEASTITSINFRNKKGIPAQRSFFVTKFHADDAKEVWTTPIGVTQVNRSTPPSIKDIVVDHQGSAFITGHFPGVLIFGNDSLRTTPSRNKNTYNFDIFLAKIDQNGKHLWHRKAGGNDGDNSNSMVLTSKGVMITGMASRRVTFGKVSFPNTTGSMFAAEYDTNGNALWAKGSNSKTFVSFNAANGIATNGKDTVIIGTYRGNATAFGNIRLKETGYSNVYVAKMQ